MTIAIPSGRTLPLQAKSGGGFESAKVAGPEQRTITGAGFGSGPNVVLFDRFDGADLAEFDLNGADIGAWTSKEVVTPGDTVKYATQGGRSWFSGRDPARIADATHSGTKAVWLTGAPFTEFRLSHRLRVPSGYISPGSDTPGVHGTSSGWKPLWLAQNLSNSYGGEGLDEYADVVVPTHQGSGSMFVSGNSNGPRVLSPVDTGLYSSWSFTSDNFYSYYQGNESSQGSDDAPIEWLKVDDTDVDFVSGIGDPWRTPGTEPTVRSYSGLKLSAYYGNQPGSDWTNVWPLHGDVYLAIGPNSRACVMTGDAATIAACTQIYTIPPDSWTDTEVRYTPVSHEALTYTHIILADGTLIENAEGV